MRALLVVNPKATTTSRRTRDVLARALGSDLKLDVVETQHRGHAVDLGAQAVREDYELVVVLGGDGTVNEVVNGMLGQVPVGAVPSTELPALAVVPGGSTNVFHRALDIPRDPVEATGSLLDALREGRRRRIGLGRADERWFTFTAGMGLDADAVRVVEEARAAGKPATPTRFAVAALRRFFHGTERRRGLITLERDGAEPLPGLFLAVVGNTAPWTYFGSRPVVMTPGASFDRGLDLVVLRRMRTAGTLLAAGRMLRPGGIRGRAVQVFEDLDRFRLSAEEPLHFQLDGEYLGERRAASLVSVPAALTVIA